MNVSVWVCCDVFGWGWMDGWLGFGGVVMVVENYFLRSRFWCCCGVLKRWRWRGRGYCFCFMICFFLYLFFFGVLCGSVFVLIFVLFVVLYVFFWFVYWGFYVLVYLFLIFVFDSGLNFDVVFIFILCVVGKRLFLFWIDIIFEIYCLLLEFIFFIGY